jgi:hypothetical protein
MKKILLIIYLTAAVSAIAAEKPKPTSQASKPLKIYILAGQSNMVGHARVSTFDYIGMDEKTLPMLNEMRDEKGDYTVCEDVWITSIGNYSNDDHKETHGKLTAGYGGLGRFVEIGPEFTFGIYMQKIVDQPILLIKTAWGGKTLNTNFRSPSAGAYEFSEAQIAGFKSRGKDIDQIKADKVKETGHYYRLMMEQVKKVLKDPKRVYPGYDKSLGYELAGFVWFQGWNDLCAKDFYPDRDKPNGYDEYSKLLSHFIRDVRKDLDAPKMPFVIGALGAGGPAEAGEPRRHFADAMAAPAQMDEFKGNVKAVMTEDYWDAELASVAEKNGKIKARSKRLRKAGELTKEQIQVEIQKMEKELFTAEDLKIKKGLSNAGYHYMGSAKIIGQIGKAFAEALE